MKNSVFIAQRLGIGIVAMLGAALLLDLVPNPFVRPVEPGAFHSLSPLALSWSALEGFLAACIGAYVARVNFTATAVLVGTGMSLISIRLLQFIAEPVQTIAYTEILARNAIGISVSIAAIVVGAELGRLMARRNTETRSEIA